MGLFGKNQMPAFVLSEGDWWNFSEYLVESWPNFASLAWETYLTAGRGFVRLNSDRVCGYVSASAPALIASRDRADRELLSKCARYRPDREIVVLGSFARDEKALRAGKIDVMSAVLAPPTNGMPNPPDAAAYAAVRNAARGVATLRAEQLQRQRTTDGM